MLMLIIAVVCVGASALWYLFVSGMACAFGSLNGNCRTKMPWEMHGEDFVFIALPLCLSLGLLALAIFLYARKL